MLQAQRDLLHQTLKRGRPSLFPKLAMLPPNTNRARLSNSESAHTDFVMKALTWMVMRVEVVTLVLLRVISEFNVQSGQGAFIPDLAKGVQTAYIFIHAYIRECILQEKDMTIGYETFWP